MSYVKCLACPSHTQCAEAGQCLNTVVILHMNRPGASCQVQDAHLATTAGTVSLPANKAPRGPAAASPSPKQPGGVLGTINAACDAALAAAGTGDRKQAARAALVTLLARGINENSARKGVGVWARST